MKTKDTGIIETDGGKFAAGLVPLLVKLTDLKPDPENARRRDDQAVGAIMLSLSRFGQMKPIVATAEGIVVAGNGLFEAAKRLKWSKVAAVIVSLDRESQIGYAVADNRIGDLSYFDDETLSTLIGELAESDPTAIIGFSDDELAEILGTAEDKGGPKDDEEDLHRKKDELGSDHLVMVYCSKDALPVILEAAEAWKEEHGVTVEVS